MFLFMIQIQLSNLSVKSSFKTYLSKFILFKIVDGTEERNSRVRVNIATF